MEIVAVRVLDRFDQPVVELVSGDPLQIVIEYVAPSPIPSPIFSVALTREDGVLCYSHNTAAAGATPSVADGPGRMLLQLDRLDLNRGFYRLDVGVYERDWAYAYDYHCQAYPLLVQCREDGEGVLRAPTRWSLMVDRAVASSSPSSESSPGRADDTTVAEGRGSTASAAGRQH